MAGVRSGAGDFSTAVLLHDPSGQRSYAPRLEALASDLAEFGTGHESEADAADALTPRLAAVRDQLVRSTVLREQLLAAGLGPGDLTSVADLPAFPTLDRALLAERWEDLAVVDDVLAGTEPDTVVVVQSSGSTGQPVSVVRDRYECLLMWGVLRYWLDALAVELPPQPSVALLDVLPRGMEYSADVAVLDDGRLHRISTHRPRPMERLLEIAPSVLFSDPAGLHWLAAQPGPLPEPRLVLTSAQVFTPTQREMFAASVRAPVVNYYAATETGPIAWECVEAPGRFHVLAPLVYVEAPDGEVIVTRLAAGPYPMVRYRTGDRGTVTWERCVCGRRGWVIHGLAGRRECRFRRPDGALVDAWQLAWVFKLLPLVDFAMTQLAPARFEARLVDAEPSTVRSVAGQLRGALADLGWKTPDVSVVSVERLPAPDGGKPEPFRAMAHIARDAPADCSSQGRLPPR